jgi:hypothetical protein
MPTPFPNLAAAVLVKRGTFYGYRSFQHVEQFDVLTAATWDYDVAAALGVEAANYDLDKTEAQVYVLDASGGAMAGYFVPADMSAVKYGIKNDGKVRVNNTTGSTVTCLVRIIAYHKVVPAP